MKKLRDNIVRAFNLTEDLLQHLETTDLLLTLKELPSNNIGQQFYCIIGARESYIKAIEAGGWQGFSCSLKDVTSKEDIEKYLNNSSELLNLLTDDMIIDQVDLAFDLLEHEIQHHGQLIRYIYGNKLTFPKSWHDRYTV